MGLQSPRLSALIAGIPFFGTAMSNVQNLLLISLLVGFVLLEYLLGRVKTFNTGKGDNVIDLLSMVLLAGLTQPFIFFVVGSLGDFAFPEYRDVCLRCPGMPWPLFCWSAMT